MDEQENYLEKQTKKVRMSKMFLFLFLLLLFTSIYFGTSAMIITKQYNQLADKYNLMVDEVNNCKRSFMGTPTPTFIVPVVSLNITP